MNIFLLFFKLNRQNITIDLHDFLWSELILQRLQASSMIKRAISVPFQYTYFLDPIRNRLSTQ